MMWMVISPMFTMLNKWCFTEGGFPFPVTLTALHMGSCFVVFGAISWLPRGIRARVLPDVDTSIPSDVYLKGFVPAALLMAVSLGFGNLALLYTTVIFVQLIKPLNVVITSIAAFAWGLEVPTLTHLIIVTIVAGGVCVAAFSGAEFSLIGLLCQLMASASEGLRLIILQGVMQTNLKLDPVTTVYRFAPLAGLVLCLMSFVLENPLDFSNVHAPGIILMNCLSAVILNILIALVISRTSAVVSVLAGIAKDIGTISASSYIFAQPVTSADMLAYCISLTGICMFKVYKDRLSLFVKEGFIGGWHQIICSLFVHPKPK
jgi:solute carrier family 35 protein C2